MKKNIFFTLIATFGILVTDQVWAQTETPDVKKSEEIIIRKNGDSVKKMTIEIDGDKVTVNGKPLSDYHNGDITIVEKVEKDKGNDNFSWAPDNNNDSNWELFQNDVNNDTPHAFLGVLSSKANNGVKITEVVKGSAAEKAGLAVGDVITKVDDNSIGSPSDLLKAITAHKPGDEVKVYYLRDNKMKDTDARLGKSEQEKRVFSFRGNPQLNGNDFNFQMPLMPGMNGMNGRYFKFFNDNNKPKLGLKIEDTETGNGVKVLAVEEGSAADKAGIKKGDVITELNNEKVSNVNEVVDQLQDQGEKDKVNIKAMRNNKAINFEVKVPKKLNSADL